MLGIIIVSYKNPDRTIEYIKTQLPNLKQEHVVVVVNNASTMEDCDRIAKKCNGIACAPNQQVGLNKVYVIHSEENLGFAKGNNLGFDFLMLNNPCDHILFSNDDILIAPDTDLSPMIQKLGQDASIGAIGPDIVGLDGRHQSPHNKKITAYRQIGWALLPILRGRKKQKNISTIPSSTPAEGQCYWVSGAFFIMRSSDFSEVGGFEPETFLYGEEPILAERLKVIGKSMYFYPKVSVMHLEGGTTHSNSTRKHIRRWSIESNCLYYRKYLKTPSFVVFLYKKLSL